MTKRLITAEDIIKAAQRGDTTVTALPDESIVTPMARDQAEALGVMIDQGTISGAEDNDEVDSLPDELIVSWICELIRDKLPSVVDAEELERLVRQKVATRLETSLRGPESAEESDTCIDGVCLISGRRLMTGGIRPVPVDEKVLIADALPCIDGYKLAGGCMQWENASFSRTVEFPEVDIIIEGELDLAVGSETLAGRPGDMLYLPKGVTVTYGTSSMVRIACINCIA